MKKKASDYSIGDRFLEANHHDAGTVVSLVLDPTRITRAFILVLSNDGNFTIYSCLRDAVSEPSLARNIPEPVMRQFLLSAYLGGRELKYTPGMTERVPVPARLPEMDAVKPMPEQEESVQAERAAPIVEYGPAPAQEPEPVLAEEPLPLTPELDFP